MIDIDNIRTLITKYLKTRISDILLSSSDATAFEINIDRHQYRNNTEYIIVNVPKIAKQNR